ncbi:hypothetical protein F5887DRAFT_1205044 [Amanita rubescens]|nr:hypothetical protein F5887DRAFT_1205044 [Amanita rubescens]
MLVLTLDLWKPKGPIAAKPEKTLAARIGSLEGGLSEFADKLDPTDSVFDIFSMSPPKHEIHIIVKAPATENDEENGDDVLPATPPPIIDTDWPRLLIRAEYLRIYKWVEERYTEGKVYRPPAIIVAGQPGIGKSFWAYYVLRRRLGENPPVWTIIDSAQSPSGIPSTLARFEPGVFPIYITSPNPGRWSGIMQSWTSNQVIMNPWTKAEIEYATNFLFSNQKLHDVLERYDSLGPTARFCFELTSDEVTGHISDRDNAINETSPDLLKTLFSDSSQLSLDTLSHKICLIRRRPIRTNAPILSVGKTDPLGIDSPIAISRMHLIPSVGASL